MSDPAARSIPVDAWRNVDQLSIIMGTVKLRSAEDKETACKLLQQMNHDPKLISNITRTQNRSRDSATLLESPKPDSMARNIVRTVSLHGLESAVNQKAEPVAIAALYGRVKGNGRFILNLSHILNDTFAKFKTNRVVSKTNREVKFGVMTTHLLRPKAIRTLGKHPIPKEPDLDVASLCDRYKDFIWAKDVPLEKICLSDVGLKDVWSQGRIVAHAVYRDIASVALPGAHSISLPSTKYEFKHKYAPASLISSSWA